MEKAHIRPRYDFHTHTLLSDGELLPIELIRRAMMMGHKAVAITDHVSISNIERVISETIKDCNLAEKYWDNIIAIPGVEITHVPVKAIDKMVKIAKRVGAQLIVVHGETIIEPVEEGTNMKAVSNTNVDILAHPGFITEREAEIAEKNDVFIELTARQGHMYTNSHIVNIGNDAKVDFLVNTDAHDSTDLITTSFAEKIAMAAGLSKENARKVVENNPKKLLRRIKK